MAVTPRARIAFRQENADFVKVAPFHVPFVNMAKSRANTPPKDYESALSELESLIGEMETGQLPLEASLAAYKRGAELLQYCRLQLGEAEQQVRILENGMLQPFRTDVSDD